MLAQSLFLISLQFIGILWGLTLKRWLDSKLMIVSGFLWGTLTWVLLCFITSVFLDSALTSHFMLSLMIGLTGILLLAVIIKHPNREDLLWAIGSMLIFSFFTLIFVTYNISIFSYDSYILIFLGQQIGAAQELNSNITTSLASRGIFIPLIHTASHFLNIDYLYAFQPLLAISGLGTIFYQIYQNIDKKTPQKIKLLICVLAISTLLSSYFLVFQSAYIQTNLPAAIYLFLFITLFWRSLRKDSMGHFYLGLIALTGFVLSRTETVLGAAIFLFLTIPYLIDAPNRQKKLLGILYFTLCVFAWYLYLMIHIGNESPILTPERIILLLVPYIVLTIVLLLSINKKLDNLFIHIPRIMLFVFIAVVIATFFLKPDHMSRSLISMFSNILYDFGRWGVLWKTLIILGLLSLVWPAIKNEKFLSYGILLYFILIFIFSFARIPYLSTWGDSSNRMLTHLVPIIIFYFSLKFNLKWKDWNQLSDLLLSTGKADSNK